ncbi:hypothetical protein [Tunturibacter empetritectus]|uniref:Uncharacterized protein n=1 Tax=Tunturiibacter lichenicola TaxID=2051959 RepID=A0A7W8J8V0_9BACT|nr:hypothetical protein [Edaphobacter lichenicola]MBB5344799.1 hypothetical protein [Edaphobacter lichenicola]
MGKTLFLGIRLLPKTKVLVRFLRLESGIFLGIYEKNVPVFEQNQEKPEKTCGNQRKGVDKARGKAEGELRYGSPHPHEHW